MILMAVAILAGTGFVFAILIALANQKLRVWEDPRIDQVTAMLPGANCGACGLPGCRAFAEQAVGGKVNPAKCNVVTEVGLGQIASLLGVAAGQQEKRVARLRCAGGSDVAVQEAEYRGLATCAAAATVSGGGKACSWGCLGYGDCAVLCTFGAIVMNGSGLPIVDPVLCTACGDCVDGCPKNLFVIQPLEQKLIVQCSNLVASDDIRALCLVACTACGKCVMDAAPGLISVESGLAVIDYSKNDLADAKAIARCPTDSIVWVEGAQSFGKHAAMAGSSST
jgi:Na+-translocating ferredoxin:NAD+ oxidoreductase RNF subunit RnfB